MVTLGPVAWKILDIVRVFALLSVGIWLLLDIPAKKKSNAALPWYDYMGSLVSVAIAAWMLEDLLSVGGRLQPLMGSLLLSILTAFDLQLKVSLAEAGAGLLGVIKIIAVVVVGGIVLFNYAKQAASGKGVDWMGSLNPLIGVAVVSWAVLDLMSPTSSINTLVGLIVTLIVNTAKSAIGV